MGKRNLAETIRETTRRHLEEENGLLLGQSVSAVGWVNGTVPDTRGIVELPMTDVAGAGFAVGAAMVGRRPFFVIRFQDFLVLNGSPLINYAAKVKELHGQSAPVFIRAIAAEGIGPVHSTVLHGMFMHFPGFKICAPMSPGEYEKIYTSFMKDDDPYYVSEHRFAYQNKEEFEDIIRDDADITIFLASSPRLFAAEASKTLEKEGTKCNIIHLLWLKPFTCSEAVIRGLKKSGKGLVIDAGHEICGASRSIAYELGMASGVMVHALGLKDHTKCLCPPLQNKAPEVDEIVAKVRNILKLK